MDKDFVLGGGVMDTIRAPFESLAQIISAHAFIALVVIIALILTVVALFFGWIGTAVAKKEGMRSCMMGSSTPLCKQTRESLTSSALAQGMDADPTSFCKSAGASTDDPYDYLRGAVGESTESLTPYATMSDRMDQNLAIAMQH